MMELLKEDGGNFWLQHDGRGHLVWSPRWRSEVPQAQRHTHVGAMGDAECIGWSDAAPPMFGILGAVVVAHLETGDAHEVEAAVLANGGALRAIGTPPKPAQRA